MEARDLLRNGDPVAALARLKEEVRKAPRDVRLRTFLFQLFAVFGEWDRALTQLSTAAQLDKLTLPMSQAYRAAIRCEMLRARVFAGTQHADHLRQPAALDFSPAGGQQAPCRRRAGRRRRSCATRPSRRRRQLPAL